MTKVSLRFAGLTQKTIAAYQRALANFFEYLEAEGYTLPSSSRKLDEILSHYIEVLYFDDQPITYAGHLLSGIRRFLPHLRFKLPKAKQWFSNWRAACLPSPAVPLPASVALALAGLCLEVGESGLACALLLGFTAFLRTSELASLRYCDLSFKPSSDLIVVALSNTKTGKGRAQSVLVRDPFLPYLLWHAQRGGATHLWPGSTASFRAAFRLLCQRAHLTSYNFTPYSLRRGGASHAFASGVSFDQLLERGRWQSVKTARLYLDTGRAALILLRFPPHTLRLIHQLAQRTLTFCEHLRRGRQAP